MSPIRERPGRVVRDVSAGGVIVQRTNDEIEVVLVGREHPEHWTIPKGTPLVGETIEQAAIREVGEETGLRVRIVELLGEITYRFAVRGTRHQKTVHFFLMQAIGGDTANHDWEYDYAEWLPAEEALGRISFPNEAAILEEAIQVAQARPLAGGLSPSPSSGAPSHVGTLPEGDPPPAPLRAGGPEQGRSESPRKTV